MLFYFLFLAIVGAGCCHGPVKNIALTRAASLESRIVNGQPAPQGAHPHQATLQLRSGYYWYHICGGSLIAPNKVLTAAHCLDDIAITNLRIGLGWHTLSKDSGYEQTFTIDKISVHRNYNANAGGYPNDIAVLTLSGSATLNSYVNTVAIAPAGSSFADETCIISGWGKLSGDGGSADALKQAHIVKITNEQCELLWSSVFGARIYSTHICVYEQPKSSCSGDSGGPMICNGFLAGVTSWGVSTCDGTFPSVYVRTSEYITWIAEQL